MRYAINPGQPLAAQARKHGLERRGSWGDVVLYRFFAGDDLLYVGVTGYIPERWQSHKNRAAWWPQVTHVTVETHPYMNAALEAEVHAIHTERPRHNRRSAQRALHDDSLSAH